MKRVLITGANSYVGTNVEKWLMKEPDNYYVETLDMKNHNWVKYDFSSFDVVFHVAGIAHVSTRKNMKDLYFKVNRDLAIQTALKAKKSGVKQFIFMSSMIVYNSKETRISDQTKPNPDNFYGLSKLQAEIGIESLQDETFNVVILRPPMIYGPNSKGNFNRLIKVSKYLFVIPKIDNKRSILNINNLAIYIEYCILNNKKGYIFPQDKEYMNTTQLIYNIRKISNKKTIISKALGMALRKFVQKSRLLRKLFSDYYYEYSMTDQNVNTEKTNVAKYLSDLSEI